MKKMKRLLAVLLTMVMVMTMGGMSVMASQVTSTTYSITIKNTSGSRNYQAYQIFTGTLSGGTLSSIDIGEGIDLTKGGTVDEDPTAITSALMNSTLPISINVDSTTYETVGALAKAILTGANSVGEVANFLTTYGGTGDNQSENVLIAFANVSYEYKSDKYKTAAVSATASDGYYTYTFSELSAGYYMIVETTTSSSVDAVSRYMLYLTSDETYETKEVAPSLTKTLSDGTASTSATIGDSVSYILTSGIPDTSGYTSYTYEITDTISSALSLNAGNGNVSENAKSLGALDIVVTIGSGTDAVNLSGIRVKDSSDASAGSNYSYYYYTVSDSGNTTLKIVFNDMISLQSIYGKDAAITVTYSATLTASADIGEDGNENKAYITYSNDPSTASSTKTTIPQEVVVYSYELDITKVDANDSSTLAGAEFYLYKEDDSGNKVYAVSTGTCTDSISPSSATSGNTYTLSSESTTWVSDTANATKMVSGADGIVKIAGLGDGTYYLTEVTPPTGYTVWESDKTIVISSKTTTEEITSLSSTVDNTKVEGSTGNGIISFKLTNTSSSALPSTGGIGTTIFYIVGTILALGAAVILVTRRRMAR